MLRPDPALLTHQAEQAARAVEEGLRAVLLDQRDSLASADVFLLYVHIYAYTLMYVYTYMYKHIFHIYIYILMFLYIF